VTSSIAINQTVLVVGGGISGMKEAGLDGHVIQPEKLQQISERKI